MFATVATLIFVPVVYRLLRSNRQPASHFAAARRPSRRRNSFRHGPNGDDMKPENEILDPYAEPDDKAAAELAVVRRVRAGTGGRILRMAMVLVARARRGLLLGSVSEVGSRHPARLG